MYIMSHAGFLKVAEIFFFYITVEIERICRSRWAATTHLMET